MLSKIIDALNARKDITAWTVRHITSLEAQVYAVPKQIESQRDVNSETYKVDVLRSTTASDGSPATGSGNITILPGDDIASAIDQAALMASLVANPVYSIPGATTFPDIELVDEDLKKDPTTVMNKLMDDIRSTAAKNQNVHLTAAECFGKIDVIHLVNSRGIDAEQEETSIAIELVLQTKKDEREAESFVEMSRRRVTDINPAHLIEEQSQCTLDLLDAKTPPTRLGAVVLHNDCHLYDGGFAYRGCFTNTERSFFEIFKNLILGN